MEPLRMFEHDGRVLRLFAYEPEAARAAETPRPGLVTASTVRTPQMALSRREAPGAGRFEIERPEVELDDDRIVLTARVTGPGVAYIYAELLLRDPVDERYYGPVWRKHVQPPRIRKTRGVVRPVWDDPVEVAVESRPRMRVLTDGAVSALCFSTPGPYGDPDHRVDGLYTPAGGGRPLRAVLTIGGSGEVKSVVAQKEHDRRSLPRVLLPKAGDRFAPLVTVFTPPAAGGEWIVGAALADEVTFPGAGLRVEAVALIPGGYVAGLVVQDLDGRLIREYVPVAFGP